MAAYRIQNVLYSDQGVRRRIGIWDSTWVAATITSFECNDFEIEYDRCDKFLTPLIPSSCYYNLIDDGSAAFTTFKTALSIAQEDQFKLVVELWNGASYDIEWAGIIMTDLISWDNTPAPRPFEIVAKCGLNRLEKIYFDKLTAAPYSTLGVATMLKVIFDCLSYAGTAQFWNGSSKPYITNDSTWHDTAQTAITQADILSYIHIGKEFLIDDPLFNTDFTEVTFRGTDDPPLKGKKILHDLLQAFGLRILLSGGSWQIQQVSRQDYVSVSIGYYDYLGVYGGATAQTIRATENGTTLAVLSGGKFGYYPPVRLAKAQIYPNNILKGYWPLGSQIDQNNLTDTSATFALGTLYGGAGLQLQINVNYDVLNWSKIASDDYYIEVNTTITAGSYRIKNKTNYLAAHRGGTASWTTVAGDKYNGDVYYSVGQYKPITIDKPDTLSIRTEDMPFTSESSCTLAIVLTLKSVRGKAYYPSYSELQVYFKNVEVSIMDTASDPPVYGNITQIEKANPNNPANISNSIEIDYGLMRFTNSLYTQSVASLNTILVTAPNGASPKIPMTTWDAGYATDEDLVSTLLKETLALQRRTVKKYTGSFRSTIYNAFKTISYDSDIWVFMGGRFSGKSDTWDAEWFSIGVDFTMAATNVNRKNELRGTYFAPSNNTPTTKPLDKYPISPRPQLKISGKKDAATSPASFDVDASAFKLIRAGDRILMLSPNTQELVQDFEVTADVEIGNTSIAVTAETLTYDIWQDYFIEFDPKEVTASEKVRCDYLQVQEYSEQGKGIGYNQTWQLKVNTTGVAATTMTSDGGAISGVTNIPSIPIDSAFAGIVHIVAKKQNTAECSYYIRQFLAKNDSGISTIEGTIQTIGTDIEGLLGLGIAVTIDDTADSIHIDVSGIGGQNINWSAQLFGVISVYA